MWVTTETLKEDTHTEGEIQVNMKVGSVSCIHMLRNANDFWQATRNQERGTK